MTTRHISFRVTVSLDEDVCRTHEDDDHAWMERTNGVLATAMRTICEDNLPGEAVPVVAVRMTGIGINYVHEERRHADRH